MARSPRTLLPALVLATLAWPAPAARAQESVGIDIANAPFMYQRDGEAAGLYPALLRAAFARMGQPLTLQALPWGRVVAALETGRAGAAGMYKTTERLRRFDFSEPLFVEQLYVYAPAARAAGIRSVSDLKGLRIGVLRGWNYGDAFDTALRAGELHAEPAASDVYNFRKLSAGRLDAVLAVEQSGSAQLRSGAFPGVAPTAAPLLALPAHLVFLKNTGRQALLRRFNLALQELKASGDYRRMVDDALAESRRLGRTAGPAADTVAPLAARDTPRIRHAAASAAPQAGDVRRQRAVLSDAASAAR